MKVEYPYKVRKDLNIAIPKAYAEKLGLKQGQFVQVTIETEND